MRLNFILTLMLIAVAASASTANDEHKRDPQAKDKNLFVFKTDKKMIGATVEIYSAAGEFITSQHLQRRNLIIDFNDVKFGTYTIKVSKGNYMKEFQFIKL